MRILVSGAFSFASWRAMLIATSSVCRVDASLDRRWEPDLSSHSKAAPAPVDVMEPSV